MIKLSISQSEFVTGYKLCIVVFLHYLQRFWYASGKDYGMFLFRKYIPPHTHTRTELENSNLSRKFTKNRTSPPPPGKNFLDARMIRIHVYSFTGFVKWELKHYGRKHNPHLLVKSLLCTTKY